MHILHAGGRGGGGGVNWATDLLWIDKPHFTCNMLQFTQVWQAAFINMLQFSQVCLWVHHHPDQKLRVNLISKCMDWVFMH